MIGLPQSLECPVIDAEEQSDQSIQMGMLDSFFQSLKASRQSCLLLDFDGTLAPFRVDPSKVRPWAGVASLLDEIRHTGRTHIAIVTGRPALNVSLPLGLSAPPEVWGLHGAEHLFPDGHIERKELAANARAALEAGRAAINAARVGVRVEEKWNAVVVHWRGLPLHSRQAVESRAFNLLHPFSRQAELELLQFDCGLELRAGPNKGDAVRNVLKEISVSVPIAYLGDDTTDEYAFQALEGRGLSVLVRRERRPSAAQIWLRPPAELRGFLTSWLRAIRS